LLFILAFSGKDWDHAMNSVDDFDPIATKREAAMFYGLFLRGHSVEDLRKDIDISKETIERWTRTYGKEASFRENLQRVYQYRKQVLAIFDELVTNERNRPRLQ